MTLKTKKPKIDIKVKLAEIQNIPTVQIKGQFLMIDRRSCFGKCKYKQ